MSQKVLLAVLDIWNTDTNALEKLYIATKAYQTKRSDTPPDVSFHTRMIQPGSIAAHIFRSGSTSGKSNLALGELVLNNAGGGLDYMLEYGFDGRDALLLVVDDGGAFDDAVQLLSVTMEQPEWTENSITIRLRDKQFETKRPSQPSIYLGNNTLPNGLEGVAEDLRGKPKPYSYGAPANVTPRQVNSARLIYQVHTGLAAIPTNSVFDNGVALTAGAAYASQADMETTAPAAGGYRVWATSSGTFFRLGSTPAGVVTAEVLEGATAADRTVAQVWKKLLLQAGFSLGNIDTASITAHDTVNSAPVGLYIDEQEDLQSVLDRVASTTGSWWGQDSDGQFKIERLEAPSGTPTLVITRPQVLRLERLASSDVGWGLPVWEVVAYYGRNYTVQTGTAVAGSVTQARRGYLAEEWRSTRYSDPAVKTAHPQSPTLELWTLFTNEADAYAEAQRVQQMRGVHRDRYEVTFQMSSANPNAIWLGQVVQLFYHRFNLQAGKLFRVTSVDYNLEKFQVTLTLWG